MSDAELKERQRRLWAQGDYAAVALRFQPAADALVAAAGVGRDDEVLDVAAGTGNVAVASARAGARRVVAADLTPALIDVGRGRTEQDGLAVEWVEADAEALPFPDESFDCVLSAFGVMFAPNAEVAVSELRRVLRPGGRIGVTAWAPDGLNGRMTRAFERALALPRPEGISAHDWGRPEALAQLFGSGVELSHGAITWRFGSEEEALTFMEEAVPPLAVARRTLAPEQWLALRSETAAAIREFDRGSGGAVEAEAGYVVAVAPNR